MTNARTAHRFIRIAAAGLAGAAALVAPLASTASAEVGSLRDPGPVVTSPLTVKAGTVTSKYGVLTVDAATNSASSIEVLSEGYGDYWVRDHKAPLTAGAGCTFHDDVVGAPLLHCVGVKHVVVRLGNFNDVAFVNADSAITTDVDAGAGNDKVTTGESSDYVVGGTGSDTIRTNGGSDVLIGGTDAGYDVLIAGAGSDDCHQGEQYSGCDNGVVNDGAIR